MPAVLEPSPSETGSRVSLADDAALVARFRAGDGKGFELLVARHTRYAGAVALSVVGDYHAALVILEGEKRIILVRQDQRPPVDRLVFLRRIAVHAPEREI